VTPLYAFELASPKPVLLQASDHLLYGVQRGDCTGPPLECSSDWIYSLTTGGAYNVVVSGNSGSFPPDQFDWLVNGADGAIYGAKSGSSTTVFKLVLQPRSFQALGGTPGALMQARDSKLYWATDQLWTMSTDGSGLASLHAFSSEEGLAAVGPLIQAVDGDFYALRGSNDLSPGTLVRMTSSGAVTVLHAFGYTEDGARPATSLIQANDGNLYGTTAFGGSSNLGTVFGVTLDGALVGQGSAGAPGIHGRPTAPVIQGSDSNLYGTTTETIIRIQSSQIPIEFLFSSDGWQLAGMTEAAPDVVYVVNRTGGGSIFSFPVATCCACTGTAPPVVQPAKFCGFDGTELHTFSGADGSDPAAPLLKNADGNFYGTTRTGGSTDAGVVYRMAPDGSTTVLHEFDVSHDGANSTAPLIRATDGWLYGTANGGGAADAGTMFKMSPSGRFAALHAFDGGAGGATPTSGVIQASDGNFYGTTVRGGAAGLGTIFKMTPAGLFSVVHSFNGADGAFPSGGLVEADDHNLYGTTEFGGAAGSAGVVFRMKLPPCDDALRPSYATNTLTMGFSVRSTAPATFGTWLFTGAGVLPLWNVPIPAVSPVATFDVPIPLSRTSETSRC
jgi:uncharacterized repeat protein (TIGR03803 family)